VVSPSLMVAVSSISITGALSSSVMVPVAVPAVELITAPAVALERATEKVSSASRTASSVV